jgi:WhiB family transcriptional regulator, redox-sensing transcriptional regulator
LHGCNFCANYGSAKERCYRFGCCITAQWEEHPMTVMLDISPQKATASPCLLDPDRWTEGGNDADLKALCRSCPRRWLCAKEAVETPGAEGMWAGVHLPHEGRTRTFALRQLRSLAEHGGYLVRDDTPTRAHPLGDD